MSEKILQLKTSYKVAMFAVDYVGASWQYMLVSMIAYGLQPVILPLMILLSKVLGRRLEWFPVYYNAAQPPLHPTMSCG
jgi:hypothetical protein